MDNKLQTVKNRLLEEKATRKVHELQLKNFTEAKVLQEKRLDFAEKARKVIQEVAEQTQKNIEIHINTLVSSALAAVFTDPYEFKLTFLQRRNKTEADLIFSKNGSETDDILSSGGGGVADIVANLALKFALWSIKPSRNTMLLDEPTKFLHNPLYQERASDMIKEVSKKLGLQIIMISDQKNIIKSGDKIINIVNIKGISQLQS